MGIRTLLLVAGLSVIPVRAQDLPPPKAFVLVSPEARRDGFEVASPGKELDAEGVDRMVQAIQRGDFPKTTSVLVLRHGHLLYERYFGEGSPGLLNDTRSTTKTVTALAIGAAIADGKLRSVDEPAFPLLPDLRPFAHDGPAKESITMADLLTMSSALDCNDEDEQSPGNEELMYPQANWSRWAADLPVQADYQRDAQGRGPWHYCTAGTFLLGQALQRAAKEPADKYIERCLLSPLGITQMEWKRSPSGEVMTGGGLRLRSRDLAKLGALLLARGRWNGKQLLPAAWVDQMLTAHRVAYPKPPVFRYGYLIWEHDFTGTGGVHPAWLMAGTGGSAVAIVRDLDAVVVVTRQNYATPMALPETLKLLQEHVLPALTMPGR
jgi:CubicO group peptidase (beta-lactamase class C family)